MKVVLDAVDVEQRIRSILGERLHLEVPAVDQDLFEAGILDSLSFVDMIIALEEEFSVQIPLDRVNLNDFRSIARMALHISSPHRLAKEVPVGRHSAV